MSDWQLLQAYANDHSETAFAELVRLHLDWVYSVAVRKTGDPHLAEDVAQSVFVLLARKARHLRPGTVLGGWLFCATCHVAAHARRAEQRRKNREATACSMIHDANSPDSDDILWQQLAPHLDLAVAALSEADRRAILLRFYEKAPMRIVGARLGISEDAAKKRVSRAVEKLRVFLARRGVTLGGVALTSILAEKTVQAAPAALAGTVTNIALAAASTSSSALLPELARECLRAWDLAKFKFAAGLAVVSLVLVFVVTGLGGLLNPHSKPPTTAAVPSPGASAGAPAGGRNGNALSAPTAINRTSPPPKTGAITGLVLDEAGHPVAGAKVWDSFEFAPVAEDTTDQAGQFALDSIGGRPVVTVTADGFAADQQEYDPANPPGPLVFHLSQAPPLKVRVVDESGQAVAGVRLFLYQWWGSTGTLGQYVAEPTDADGSLQWLSPPKGELEMQFVKPGYRSSRANKFAADGQEHLIVLHPAATVSGNVTDAETGLPVPAFNFTFGHSQQWMPSDPVPVWDLRSKPASNGFYKMDIEEEQVPFLRIEADGYETVETDIQLSNRLEAVRDFQLTRTNAANSIRGTVLLPDGAPAAGVEVVLCTWQTGATLKGTAFDPRVNGNLNPNQWPRYRRTTDEQGFFSFNPLPGAHTLVAVGPTGLGQTHCFDFSKPLEIRLQPWGRIEGTVRTRDGQWADRKIKWLGTGNLSPWGPLDYDSEGFTTRSDATGKFTLEHVPPGDCHLEIDNGPRTAPILSVAIQVNRGETVQAQIGGVGRQVLGKLVAPPGVEIRSWTDQVTTARVQAHYDSYQMPKDLTGIAAERWKLEFKDTEAGRAWFRNQCLYDFKVEQDGSFSLPEVLPGKYSLYINASQGNLGSGPDSAPRYGNDPVIATGGTEVTVPETSGGAAPPLDLGTIILTAAH